jgi:uncharacterized membrane protein YgcG
MRYLVILFSLLLMGNTFPPLNNSPVVDSANILSDSDEAALKSKLMNFYKTTKHQLVVVTIPSLDGNDINQYSNDLYREYKLGDKERDDGLLMVFAMKEHKMRIEVGYGLEWIATDGDTGRIIRETMVPKFKSGNYYAGIDSGVDRLIKLVEPAVVTPPQTFKSAPNPKQRQAWTWIISICAVGGIGAGIGLSRRSRRRRKEKEARLLKEQQERRDRLARERREESESNRLSGQHAAMKDVVSTPKRSVPSPSTRSAPKPSRSIPKQTRSSPSYSPPPPVYDGYSRRSSWSDDSSSSSSWGSSSSSSDSFSGGGGDSGGGGSSGDW